jgi:nitroreductase/NAD-dependent dihydropyrimidine dehydrogenase PreA subunit
MPTHVIDPSSCTKCGLCAEVCGTWVYRRTDHGIEVDPAMAALCMRCGHCMAVCPTRAVQVEGLDLAGFQDFAEPLATPQALLALMRRRRSMRVFEDRPVPREVLQQIVDAAATAPMGIPPSGVEVTVLSRREQVAAIVPVSIKQIQLLNKLAGNFLGRLILKRMMGAKAYREVVEYLLPLIAPAMDVYQRDGTDFVTWGAPAMMLFHSAPDSLAGETDMVLAATHAMLMAEALGVGNIMLGFANAAVQQDKALKRQFGIPEKNEIRNALALGYSQRTFRRSVLRELRAVHWP